jgi:cyclophilin family peptidyl-prolyl cis-trans isomerase
MRTRAQNFHLNSSHPSANLNVCIASLYWTYVNHIPLGVEMPSRDLFRRLFRLPVRPHSERFCRPRLESLEDRTTPTAAVNLVASSFSVPTGSTQLVPLSLVSQPGGAVNYTATSSNSQVTAQVLVNTEAWDLNVSGKDANGNSFTGDLVMQLFPNESPVAVNRIVTLTNNHFYDGLTFHRVIQSFVAQGGDPLGNGTGGSSMGNFNDEFSSDLTFNDPGLVAFANSGPDTNNSQFFITAVGLPLSQEPQNLNFRYDIFGQLVRGFSTFNSLMSTPVEANSTGEISKPITNVVINSAKIINDPTTAVLSITSAAGFQGSSTITVTANDGSGPSTAAFSASFVAPTVTNPPFLGPIANQTTFANTPVNFQIPATTAPGDTPLTYVVTDPNNFGGTPANVTVNVNQSTGVATVTPANGFTGTVQLLVGVRDQTARNLQPLTSQSQYDTHLITLTVEANNGSSQSPLINPITLPPLADGTTLTFTAFAVAPSVGGVQPPLTYSLGSSSPVQATINAQTGVVTWTPSQAQGQAPGVYTLTVVATETNNTQLSASQTFQVTVTGSSRFQGVNGIPARQKAAIGLTQSAEYYSDFIVAAYNKYLSRSPDSVGLAYWLRLMQSGLSDEHLEAGFIGSAEYIQNNGGAGAGWITAMYKNLLGRTPAQSEVQFWLTNLNNGELPATIAFGFAASQEREAQRVNADYQQYLGRSASSSEVSFWVNDFLNGGTNEAVIAGFIGSQEYFQSHGNDGVDWLYSCYHAVLNRQPDAGGLQFWLGQL